jgi:hypothetical protein
MKGGEPPDRRLPISPGNDAIGRRAWIAAPDQPLDVHPTAFRPGPCASGPIGATFMQASVSFPYNTLQPYAQGSAYQDYQLAIPCPVAPSNQTPTVQVTPNSSAPLILVPGNVSGGNNTATVTQGPTYQNGQIVFTVRATPDPSQVNNVTNVILNLQVVVTYQCSNPTDGVTPTAAVTIYQPSLSNYQCGLSCTNTQNPSFFGHNPRATLSSTYPPNQPVMPYAALGLGGGGDVTVNVGGSGGNPTWTTILVSVNVNQSSQPQK